jgi:hypothetical protein
VEAATHTDVVEAPPAAPVDQTAVAAPELAPATQAPAGMTFEGALLRGLESGLPAAPQLSDLQVPPPEPVPLPSPQPWRMAPPDIQPEPLPDVLALPAQAAPFRAGSVRVPPAAAPPQLAASDAVRSLPDAAPAARPPALVEADPAAD